MRFHDDLWISDRVSSPIAVRIRKCVYACMCVCVIVCMSMSTRACMLPWIQTLGNRLVRICENMREKHDVYFHPMYNLVCVNNAARRPKT